MRNFPDRETVERIRREYPAGTRIALIAMDDVQSPPVGTHGTVLAVDDVANLLVRWNNGSTLNVIFRVDRVRKLKDSE